MAKRLYFLISFVFMLSLASASYGQGPIYLDFDQPGDVNTQPGFTSFLITDSGKTINGITIDLAGDLDSARRNSPIGVPFEQIYRDFIFGKHPTGITITLWGLGAAQECEITIYAFDSDSPFTRAADWTANGAKLFTTGFDNTKPPVIESQYAFTGTAYADEFGRIILDNTKNVSTPWGENFAFVNALVVIPKGNFVPVKYAHRPQPFNGRQTVSTDVVLSWEPGRNVDKYDVYLGTDTTLVENANRNNPLNILVTQGQNVNSYDPEGLLELDTTYLWRVDEVNDISDTIFKGEIWNFKTLPYFIVESFDSYASGNNLGKKWKNNGTGAVISLEKNIVRNGNSMKYEYKNNVLSHSSQVSADIADLGIDEPDWLGMGANALVLYFCGETNNPASEQMYISLTDGDTPSHTATVMYHSMKDVTIPQWQKWNIPLADFAGVNLSNIAKVSIGFGDNKGSGEGAVYFEDIRLDVNAEQVTEATGIVNYDIVYQRLDGWGGAAAYDVPNIIVHPKKEEVYDLLFKDLKLDFLRIRNTYGYPDNGENLAATAVLIKEAQKPERSPNLKILLTPWSPPAYLKSNNDIVGGTLKGGPYNYVYSDYAQWWYDSILQWEAHGVKVDYITIQNEPETSSSHDTCKFSARETTNYAGYDRAFESVYNKLNAEMGSAMPKMWAPDTADFGEPYINRLNKIGQMYNIDGINFHLYFVPNEDYDDPDTIIPWMKTCASNYGYKPLHMTEYVKLNTIPNFDMGMKFAWHIYNCLYYLHTDSFFNWTLFRGPASQGGIVTLTPTDYIIRPQYWFFKAYTHFTGKDWLLLGTSVNGPGAENLRMSAFESPDRNELVIVVLNKSKARTVFTIPNLTPTKSAVYRSSETLEWADLGTFTPTMSLPSESITTIWMDMRPVADAGKG